MKLKDFIKKEGFSQRQFALKSGISPMNISRYITGSRKPDVEALFKIKTATNGLVDAGDFINVNPDLSA